MTTATATMMHPPSPSWNLIELEVVWCSILGYRKANDINKKCEEDFSIEVPGPAQRFDTAGVDPRDFAGWSPINSDEVVYNLCINHPSGMVSSNCLWRFFGIGG